MAGKGGGAWKVAYADFVTAMMAFFLVMWIVAQNKPVREAVAEYFQQPMGGAVRSTKSADGRPTAQQGDALIRKHARLTVRTPKGYAEPGDSAVRVGGTKSAVREKRKVDLHDGKRSLVGTVVIFHADKADLDEDARTVLAKLLPELVGKENKVEIRGHCSGRPPGPSSPFSDAWALCYARCLATKRFLIEGGLAEERIRLSQAGEHEPATLGVTAELQARNERVEVFMLGEMVDDLRGKREERQQQLAPSGDETAGATVETPVAAAQ